MKAKFLSLALLSLLAGCASQPEAQAKVPNRIEYYLRWNQTEFKSQHSFNPLKSLTHTLSQWLMPAAQAELPPQYQHAFSLVITPVAGKQDLQAEFHSSMVTDPSTYFTASKRLGNKAYQRLEASAKQKIACEAKGLNGWAGPAPALLSIEFPEQKLMLYVDGPEGPPGPRDNNRRHYLCNQGMSDFLKDAVAQLAEGKK